MNFYFTYESRVTLKLSTLFITVKTIAKLNPEHRSKSSGKFEIKVKKKLAVVVYVLQTVLNLVRFRLSSCRERYKNVQRIIMHSDSH